jgi:hypothetical protein
MLAIIEARTTNTTSSWETGVYLKPEVSIFGNGRTSWVCECCRGFYLIGTVRAKAGARTDLVFKQPLLTSLQAIDLDGSPFSHDSVVYPSYFIFYSLP